MRSGYGHPNPPPRRFQLSILGFRQTDTSGQLLHQIKNRMHRMKNVVTKMNKTSTSNSLSALVKTLNPSCHWSLLLLLAGQLLLATMMRAGVTWHEVPPSGQVMRRHLSTMNTESCERINTAQLHVAPPAHRSNADWIYKKFTHLSVASAMGHPLHQFIAQGVPPPPWLVQYASRDVQK